MSEIYFDNSSTTKVCPEAAQKATELMLTCYGNPSSLHTLGFQAEQALSAARHSVAAFLGVKDEELYFTSGGTEGNNLAVFGAAYARRKMGNHIVTTAIEHPSVHNAMQQLEKEGFSVTYLQPDETGFITEEQIAQAITSQTILVSIMAVNNEVGSILPVESVARAIKAAKAPALLHVDAVQAFGKLPLRPSRIGIDLMTVSAHKIHGPKGIGALFVRKGVHILPRTLGGGQEKNLRPGTESMPLIGAFGAAVDALPDVQAQHEKIAVLHAQLTEGLRAMEGVEINSPEQALPYILNFSAGKVRAETMLHYLSSKEIYVSSGSACSKGKQSPVLTAMKLPRPRIESSLRISLCRWNTAEEAAQFLAVLQTGLQELAALR